MKFFKSCLLLSVCLFLRSASAALTTGLVSYWPLDVINGTVTPDIALTNNLTVFASPTVAKGVFSNAFTFNGTSQYLDFVHGTTPTNGLPIYTSGPYTIAFWVKGMSQLNHYVFTEANTTSQNPIFILQTGSVSPYGGNLDVIIRNSSGTLIDHVRSIATVFDGTWHHVGWVDNNGAVSLYIDGALDSANFNYTPGSAALIPLDNTAIGALVRTGSPTINFAGSVDDIVLWSRALSQTEIQMVMNNSIPVPLNTNTVTFVAPLINHTNAMGDYVVLSGLATGSASPTYQWFKNGTAIAAQTSATIGPLDTTVPSTNLYTIKVTYPGGSLTNSATVVVLPDAAPNLTNGLVNYWPFDAVNSQGIPYTPDVAGGDSLALNGMDTNNLILGEFGNALNFLGSPDFGGRVGGNPIFNVTNYSVSFWVNGNPSTQSIVYGESSTNNSTPLFILTTASATSGSLDILIRNDSGAALVGNVVSTQKVFDGGWHHVVWVDQNGQAALYVDGVLDATNFSYSRTGTFTLTTSSVGALVRSTVSDYFTGAVDDVAVWNRRLSYTEVLQLQTKPVEPPANNTNAPVLLSANSAGLTQVQLFLSAPASTLTATNLANYSLTGPNGVVAISNAVLDASQMVVTLSVATLSNGSPYTVTVNQLANEFVPANIIALNSTASFNAGVYVPVTIGLATATGGQQPVTSGDALIAKGGDIGGASDQFEFAYQQISGDFDFSVDLTGLAMSDVWAKAGLMARETLNGNARFAAALATPGMSGAFFEYRNPTNTAAVRTGNFPGNFPNTWLRLKRTGNIFTGFSSYDGLIWTQTGTATITMSAAIYFGMAASSESATQSTTAQFLNPVVTSTNAVIGVSVNPHEPLGPSSRKSAIVFSEIMYKPAPRSDTNNLEFVELYNSNPYFHDISGYQIACADMSYTIPTNTILPGGGFIVVAASPDSIRNVYGITNVLGPYQGSLKKSESLQLLDEQGAVLLTVPYSNVRPWPMSADGAGHSLVLAYPSYGEGDPRAWDISDAIGGSPGVREPFTPSPLRSVVINELLAHSENPAVKQFIELYNHSLATVDLSGCILTDDSATNKFVIPNGTSIGPDGFISFDQSQLNFTLNGAGGTVYFIKPDHTRVLNEMQYEAQADGVSLGRWPNGANDLYPLSARTPGAANGSIAIGNIVINELMYDPITENDDDQYIELYNQGASAVSLANWQFTAGINFTFPSNTVIAANGYLVIARNQTNLFAKYPTLNSANTVGNFTSKLSHDGERVALAAPQVLNGASTIYVVQDEVTYGTGGRWGQWSSGGGSSLELIDPHANHRLAANWRDSDETQKSAWTTLQYTGPLEWGVNFESFIAHAQLGLLDAGECLVDNVEVDDTNGVNYVTNPTFESGLENWQTLGCMVRSSLENGGYQSAHSLHIRCTDRMWTGGNSCQLALNANTLASNQVVTLRLKARWLRGYPELLFRLNGNWAEVNGLLPVPANLGTPGAPNSSFVTNVGPAMYNVTHSPAIPVAGQAVVVTAQVHDPDGLQSLTLNYRLDPATNYISVPMTDDGTGGDAIAGDGIYSGTIPGQTSTNVVAFYISAVDNLGAATRFPALLNDNSPAPECIVMFGDGNPGGSFGAYHLWITQTNVTLWSTLGNLSNELLDGTFVNNSRVIYNMHARFAGSASHQNFNTPYGNLCHYKFEFQNDDKFLGATDFNKIHQPGNGPGDDSTLQREQTAYTLLRALGQPWLNRRYVMVFVNGHQRGTMMEDTQVPGSDIVKEHFPNDNNGFLYKMQPWPEFGPAATTPFTFESFCNLMPYVGANGFKKAPRYRWIFEIRRTPTTDSDFTNIFSLVDAANSYPTPNYVANMENLANMENWLRVFAANHAAANRDVFGGITAQNLYGYTGEAGTKYTLLMWDFNIVFDHGAWSPGQNLFTSNPQDPNTAQIYTNVTFRRMYWRALSELANGPLQLTNTAPLCNAKYNAFIADGFSVENPNAGMLPWIAQAQTAIADEVAAVDSLALTVNPNIVVSNGIGYVSGVAPIAVSTITLNGVIWPLTWTALTNWTIALALPPGTNQLAIVGIGHNGLPISSATTSVTATNNASALPPAGQVVINEIMSQPAAPNGQYIELYNNSTNIAFDLSAWQMPLLNYTFPSGSLLAPNSFLMLAANRSAFADAYGATNPVYDTFPAGLPTNDGLLSLLQPNSNVVTQVKYSSTLPWQVGANGTGNAFELIDSHQDNWRAGNWSATGRSPDNTNTAAATLPEFPPLWINEVEPANTTGITNHTGQHAPWIEIYNPTAAPVALDGLYLSTNYNELMGWQFPNGSTINAGQFLVVFTDSQTSLSTPTELHANFTLSATNGSIALSRIYNSQPQVIDYLDYAGLATDESYGSAPDGQSFVRQMFYYPTPGAVNNPSTVAPPSFIPYFAPGQVYSQNFDTLPNPGAKSVNTDNPVTINGITYSLANPFDFAAPATPTGNGGLGLPELAGWYGMASQSGGAIVRFGATYGDQMTGGALSFGAPNGTNQALGLLATSSTGFTGFGAKFINETGSTLNYITVQVTGEVWRQSNIGKNLVCYYFIDPTATNSLSTNATGYLPPLNVSFPTVAADDGGDPVTVSPGTNEAPLGIVDQAITSWPPGAALWLIWEMPDSSGKAQGLAIDNFSFAASAHQPVTPAHLNAQTVGTNLVLSTLALTGASYLVQYTATLNPPNWVPVGSPLSGTNGSVIFSTNAGANAQGYYRLLVQP